MWPAEREIELRLLAKKLTAGEWRVLQAAALGAEEPEGSCPIASICTAHCDALASRRCRPGPVTFGEHRRPADVVRRCGSNPPDPLATPPSSCALARVAVGSEPVHSLWMGEIS